MKVFQNSQKKQAQNFNIFYINYLLPFIRLSNTHQTTNPFIARPLRSPNCAW